MVLAMAAFSIEDMLIKSAANTVAIGLVLALFGLGGMLLFIVLTLNRKEVIFHPVILSRPILVRAGCEVIGRLTFALAITFSALSSASAILQAMPLIAMIGAVFIFGEKIDLRRWIAVVIGFIGVLMIIRPGLASFEAASLLALISTFGFAGRDLATRAAPPVLSNLQLGIYGFFVLIPTGLVMLLYGGGPVKLDSTASMQMMGAILFGVAGYNALTAAMRSGDVSVVSPFRYTRLVFALLFGVFVFSERPDAMTLLGSLLIVVSGIYTLMHSRKAPLNA